MEGPDGWSGCTGERPGDGMRMRGKRGRFRESAKKIIFDFFVGYQVHRQGIVYIPVFADFSTVSCQN